jgi:histone H3/H4
VSSLSEYLTASTTGERVFALLKYLASLSDNMPVGEFARTVRKALPKKGDELMATVLDQILEEGRQEGRKKGFQEGAVETLQESVAEVLEARFETVPASVTNKLRQICNPAELHVLNRKAAQVDSLPEFHKTLDDVLSEA